MHKSIFALFALILLDLGSSFAQTSEYDFSEEDKLYTKVENIQVQTTQGEEFKLSKLYNREPLILALVFTRCTGVCSPLLSNLKENIARLNPKLKFKILVVSFDTADTKVDLKNYAQLLGLNKDDKWIFGTTPQITELVESVGFHSQWDSATRQYNHDALLVGINGNGYIIKKLIGIRNVRAVEAMLKSIHNEFIISYPLPHNNSVLSCFSYDPITGQKKLKIGLFLLLVPAFGTIILLAVISRQKRQSRK